MKYASSLEQRAAGAPGFLRAPEIRGSLQNMGGAVMAWGMFAIGIFGAIIGSKLGPSDTHPH